MRMRLRTQTGFRVRSYGARIRKSMTSNPRRYSLSDVAGFMKGMVDWMQQEPWLLAYSWHDSEVGSSALIGSNGELTETGKLYATL